MTAKELEDYLKKTKEILPAELLEWFENEDESKAKKLERLDDSIKKMETAKTIIWNCIGTIDQSTIRDVSEAVDTVALLTVLTNVYVKFRKDNDWKTKPRAPKKPGRKKKKKEQGVK